MEGRQSMRSLGTLHRHFAWLVLIGMLSACSDRERPLTDVIREEERSRLANRAVEITDPPRLQLFDRADFTTPPGVLISFSGTFATGDRLLALGFSNREPEDAFFTAIAEVDPANPPTKVGLLVSEEEMDQVMWVDFFVSILDRNERRISTDSVRVRVR